MWTLLLLKNRNPNSYFLFLSAYAVHITTVMLTKMEKQDGTVVLSIGLKANLCCLDLSLLLVAWANLFAPFWLCNIKIVQSVNIFCANFC